MHPYHFARTTPDKPAYIMAGSGETVTYAQLDARSNQGAHLLRSLGLQAGDGIAFLLENHPRYFEVTWAAQRSGLRSTPISSKLAPSEIAYILRDSGAKLLVTSEALIAEAAAAAAGLPGLQIATVGAPVDGYLDFEQARAALPERPIADETAGQTMLYSSGTTGRPKGIKRLSALDPDIAAPNSNAVLGQSLYGWNADTVYLSTMPRQ